MNPPPTQQQTTSQRAAAAEQAALRAKLEGVIAGLVANYSSKHKALIADILPDQQPDSEVFDAAALHEFVQRLSDFDVEMNAVAIGAGILAGALALFCRLLLSAWAVWQGLRIAFVALQASKLHSLLTSQPQQTPPPLAAQHTQAYPMQT